MKQLSRKRRVATWLASLLVLFLVVGLMPTGLSREVLAQSTVKLNIQKVVEDESDIPKDATFIFKFLIKVKNYGEWDEGKTVSLEWKKNPSQGHKNEISYDFPEGYAFEVTELIGENDPFVFVKVAGNVVDDKLNPHVTGILEKKNTNLNYHNRYEAPDVVETTELVIQKRIEYQNQLPDGPHEFRFEIIVDGGEPIEETLTWTENGNNSSGATIVIPNLPVGASYSVKEVLDDDEFTLVGVDPVEAMEFNGDEGTASGTLAGGNQTVLTFINEYTTSCDPVEEPDTFELIVKKVVSGTEPGDQFNFQIEEVPSTNDPVSTFELGHGDTHSYDAVLGTKYKVTEDPEDGYTITATLTVVVDGTPGEPRDLNVGEDGSIEFDYPENVESVKIVFTNTWEDEVDDDPVDDPDDPTGGDPDDPPAGGSDDPVDDPGDTPGGGPGEEPGDTPGTDPGGETPGGEIVAGDEDEKPDEVVKGDEDEKAEDEELDVPVTGEGLSSYPFLALAMGLLAAAFLALGRRKPLEED